MSVFEHYKNVKGFVFDVDGVLTDGRVLVNELGEQWRAFDIKDGYALRYLVENHFPVAVISGGRSEGVRKRMAYLGIEDVFLGAHDKMALMKQWALSRDLKLEDLLFMGDDLPDAECLEAVGLPTCPADAAEEIKSIAKVISSKKGGQGAARELIEHILKVQGKWGSFLNSANG